jgi:protein O-mannosyl-transferase
MKLTEKQFTYLAGALIALVALIVYSNSFYVPLQFDDIYHVQHKALIHDLGNFTQLKTWMAIGTRPVPMFTMALNYHWGEDSVLGYHVMNLLFHIITGWVVYLLALQILSIKGLKTKQWIVDNKNIFSLLVALIFVAHPMQTQAVTYIIQRITVLASLFYLLAVLTYIKGRLSQMQHGLKQEAIIYYAATLVSFVLAMLSKQIAVTLPLVLILTEAFFIRDEKGNIQKKYLYYFSGAVALGIIIGLIAVGLPRETKDVTRGVYMVTSLKVLVKYIQMMILPIGQNLDHDIKASDSLFGIKELGSLAILLGFIYLGYYLYKRDRLISFGIFWFFITLSVESSVIPIRDFMFEHRMYLPSFGFLLAALAGLTYIPAAIPLGKKKVPAALALTILLILAAGVAANARNYVWQSDLSLWSDAVKKSPEKSRPWMWKGVAFTNIKKFEKAKECFDKCIELTPDFSMAYYNRGNVYKEIGEDQKAIADYTKAIELKKNYEMAYFNRGVIYSKKKNYKEAIRDYDKTIELNPDNSLAYYNRGNAYRNTKRYQEALSDYNNAIRLNPKYALAVYNRGLTKAATGNHQDALQDFDRAIALDPQNYLFFNGKGVSLNALKLYNEAILSYNTSINLNPKFGQAYYNRGYTKLYGLNDKNGACEDFSTSAQYKYETAKRMLEQICGVKPASK